MTTDKRQQESPSTIRGLDKDILRQIRIEALKRNRLMGDIVTEAMADWLKKNENT